MSNIKITVKGSDLKDIVAHHFGISRNKVGLFVGNDGKPYATVEIGMDFGASLIHDTPNGVIGNGGER